MTEVVSSIRRVTDIMGEISAATNEQASGVAEVGQAVAQMDQATQQNAALVEQMAAAASSLKSQAEELVQTVAVFSADGAGRAVHFSPAAPRKAPLPKPPQGKAPVRLTNAVQPPKPAAAPKPVARPAPKPAPAASEDEWETF